MGQLHEASTGDQTTPRFPAVVGAIAFAVPAFLIVAAWIGTEEHAARLECGMQVAQHTWQLLARDMKQRSIGEDAVEVRVRKVEREKTLLEHCAATVGPCESGELRRPFEAHGVMPER